MVNGTQMLKEAALRTSLPRAQVVFSRDACLFPPDRGEKGESKGAR